MIQVLNAVFGGERFSANADGSGIIDHGSHLPGFCLDKDGKLRASMADISGHIEALSGKFHGTIEADSGIFIGDLKSGAMFSSNQETGEDLPSKTFNSSDTAKTVWDYYGGRTQNVSVKSGSWGGNSGVVGLTLTTDTIPTSGGGMGLGGTTTRYKLQISLFNGSVVEKTWASTVQNTLGSSLVIDGGKKGPTYKLTLPEGNSAGSGFNQGDVYRDSAGFVRVKL
jgi:hypothetical protein